jgi:TRAP-type uncharacterized transport system substrate-binding protein
MMFGLTRGHLIKTAAAVVCGVALVWLALWYFIPSPPSSLTIGTGARGTAFEHIAARYKERLARSRVTLNIREIEGVMGRLKLLDDPKSGLDATFLFGGVTNSEQSPNLMSLGRINYAPIWIFYTGSQTIDRLTQLKGKRIIVGVAFRSVATDILAAHGVNPTNATLLPHIGQAARRALKDGEADVLITPLEMTSPLIQSLLRDPDVRLMNLAQADAIARLFPFISRLSLPQGVIDLEQNIPAADVNLIATTNAVVVRKDLHPELVYLLAQALAEEHGRAGIFEAVGQFPTQTDPEFDVAEDAREYYRNGPTFLQRYIPYWLINVAKRMIAVVVAILAVIIPIYNLAPRIYDWFLQDYIGKLYRRLRVIEAKLQAGLTDREAASLETELNSIARAVTILPMRHSDHYFALGQHVDVTRDHLVARLRAARSRSARLPRKRATTG